MVCLYSRIAKIFTQFILNESFWLMLKLFQFNMDSISSTNFPMNISSNLIKTSFILFLSKFETFIYNVVHCLISFTTHSAFCLLLWFVIFPLVILVWMACSWAAHIKLSISSFRVPFHNHCHLSWFPTSLGYCTNWLCNIISSHKIVFSSFFCFLVSILVSWIGSIKSISTDLTAVTKRYLDSFYIVL